MLQTIEINTYIDDKNIHKANLLIETKAIKIECYEKKKTKRNIISLSYFFIKIN